MIDFVDEVLSIENGREQYKVRVHFKSDNYYLIIKRLDIKDMRIGDDCLYITLMDGRVLELRITDDMEYWLKIVGDD